METIPNNGDTMLSRAIDAYFEAKALLFRDDSDFRLIRVGPLVCLHGHPGWSEVDAFYAINIEPADVVAAVRDYRPHPSHMIEVFTQAPEALREPFQELGYAPMSGTQPFLGRSLSGCASARDGAVRDLRRTAAMSEYWVERDGQPVCWGKSIATSQQAIYLHGMETLPAFRRQGLASAVLARIHSDAAAAGAKISVLCSSRSGLPLYRKAGYALLAHMQGFVPCEQDGARVEAG